MFLRYVIFMAIAALAITPEVLGSGLTSFARKSRRAPSRMTAMSSTHSPTRPGACSTRAWWPRPRTSTCA